MRAIFAAYGGKNLLGSPDALPLAVFIKKKYQPNKFNDSLTQNELIYKNYH
jgi:hypothetical protein